MDAAKLIVDYEAELVYFTRCKAKGTVSVSANVAGPGLAKMRSSVPIDEVIASVEGAIQALKDGADPELYNY